MTAVKDPPPAAGFCVCGLPLPDQPVSDWACSEVCQAAWTHHQTDPAYPHPRQIRERVQVQAAAQRRPGAAVVDIPDGTQIVVDGDPFVRVGSYWQPAGMWTPLRDQLGDEVRYRRWCPTCTRRVASQLYPATDVQECAECGHQWAGRPLLGWVESRGEPWPGLRLLLSDGQRSIARTFTQEEVAAAGQAAMAGRLGRSWLRLERQLCGGYADIDQPDQQQRQRQARRLRRDWHLCTEPT